MGTKILNRVELKIGMSYDSMEIRGGSAPSGRSLEIQVFLPSQFSWAKTLLPHVVSVVRQYVFA